MGYSEQLATLWPLSERSESVRAAVLPLFAR